MTDKTKVVKAFPFVPVLLMIFITLKLAGIGTVATWSWFWVFSPLWIPIGIALTIFFLMLVFYGITALLK